MSFGTQPVGIKPGELASSNLSSVDLMNVSSKENYYGRTSTFIDNLTDNHTYYLGMMRAGSKDSFFYKAYFYPNIDLTRMSKADRDKYIENGKSPTDLIPKSNMSHIGRVLIKGTDQVLYNPKGKVHRKLRQNEGLRVYEVQSDRYQVGGGYYVKKNKNTLYYFGHIYSNTKGYKYMAVYNPSNVLFKNFEPMQTSRVYGTRKRII